MGQIVMFGDNDELELAESLLGRNLAIMEFWSSPTNIRLVQTLNELALSVDRSLAMGDNVYARSRLPAARLYLERSITILEIEYGIQDVRLGRPLTYLASLIMKQGEFVTAQQLLKRALSIQDAHFGREGLQLAFTEEKIGDLLLLKNEFVLARSFYASVLRKQEIRFGPNNIALAHVLICMSSIFTVTGEHGRGKLAMQRALAIQTATLGSSHPRTVASKLHIAQMRALHILACSVCGAGGIKLLHCVQCKVKYYCSVACQVFLIFG